MISLLIKTSLQCPLTDLYDDKQEERHVSREVDLMDLEHRGAETKNQSTNDNLDRLRYCGGWVGGKEKEEEVIDT